MTHECVTHAATCLPEGVGLSFKLSHIAEILCIFLIVLLKLFCIQPVNQATIKQSNQKDKREEFFWRTATLEDPFF